MNIAAARALPTVLLCLSVAAAFAADPLPVHGVAMHGQPKYGPDFTHLEYTNPDAPKGGEVKLAAIGSFDTLNPFTIKGDAAVGLGGLFDTLTVNTADEAFSEYGLVAETIEIPEDRSWVAYTLRPQARFHDGTPITVDDVIFSFEVLKEKGAPFYRAYYGNVLTAEPAGERRVKFTFAASQNRELPLIVGQMPVLSKTYWSTRSFEKTTLEPPLGSGAYRIESLDPGRSITYQLADDYWARDLPINRGRDNFGRIRYDYYRDTVIALEAFKAGEFDLRLENSAKNWATGYDSPALREGLIRKDEIDNDLPTGMQGFVYNTRRPIFSDQRVREALGYAFDFEWTNRNIFYGAYTRTASYFSNSELASSGLPQNGELAMLEPFRGKLREELFTREFTVPATDGSGNLRENLRKAVALLTDAGWQVQQGKLVDSRTGQSFAFEILLDQPDFERVVLPFKRNLERLGIDMRVRPVDSAQYEERIKNFDFDMIVNSWGQSLSPGNEQRDFWSCQAAKDPGSRNLAGICDPVVDELIEQVISAPDRESLVQRTRALDRVLLHGHYVIPNWHIQAFRVAFWDKFERPPIAPKYGFGLDTWWVDAAKAAVMDQGRRRLKTQ